MAAFFAGLIIAVMLAAGSALTFTGTEISTVRRASPPESVRIGSDASMTDQGAGYGTPKRETSTK